MKIHLVNPRLPLSFSSNEYAARMAFRKYSNPPLGLLTVAAMIPDRHVTTLCDENVSPIDWNADCDVVGITGMHLQGSRMREIATGFRARGKTVVIGGPSVMSVPERYRDVADILVLGEAEQIWPACLADLERGVAHATYHAEKSTVDLAASPLPRFDLVSPRDYLSMSLQTSRGCPFQCEFCDIITLYGRKVRTKPVERVLREVERIVALGWERFFFVDDNFIGDPRYATELLTALAELRGRTSRPFYFTTQLTINLAQNTVLMRLLHEAGCRSVFIGIETPRASSLRETLKFQNVRKDLLADVERIQRSGLAVYSGIVVGFDHDDADIFDEQVQFINDARIPLPLPSILGALPGTPLHSRLAADGRLLPDTDFTVNAFYTNMIPKQMSVEALEAGYRRMVGALYAPASFANRVNGELDRIGDSAGRMSNYRWPVLIAGFAWVLGWFLVDTNRRKLLSAYYRIAATAVRRPSVADQALQRLIIYRHVCRFVSMIEDRARSGPPSPAVAS